MTTPLSPYLTFNGDCAEAMRFYQKTLGGKLDLMKMKDAPPTPHIPASDADRIMHARLAFDGGTIMAGDLPSNMKYEPMKSISLAITYPSAGEAKKVFDTLAKGGNVTMPFNSSFFADGFGMVTDRFGTPWILTGGMKPGM